jgi:hypothetical protein
MSQFNMFVQSDGPRNAVATITGILDTADANFVPVIALADFVNNDVRVGQLNGLRIDKVVYSIGDGIQLNLTWSATSEQLILALAGRGKMEFKTSGGLQPQQVAEGYTGDINLRSTGFNTQGTPPQNFSIELYMVKLYRELTTLVAGQPRQVQPSAIR